MRREMQEILPGLFLGPYSSAMKSKLPILQKHGITHIICIRQNIEANFIKPNFQQLFRYLVLDIADNPVENIIRFFPMTKEFIDESLQSGGKVLVHGNAGISRSAAFVIAYIMETFGMKYRDAFAYVQERRFCINPNAGFVHQLQGIKLNLQSSFYICEELVPGPHTPLYSLAMDSKSYIKWHSTVSSVYLWVLHPWVQRAHCICSLHLLGA
ncbi:serine/threonine/tyrosine-interacting protein isoform X3 [Moschus berezovskii]|nr:serine/threonine/tyrosine-interacting protein isoform X3 [Moschus berezovskii]